MVVLLIGKGYLPYITVGDKNYWFGLLSLLSRKNCKVFIASINDNEKKILYQQTSSTKTPIYNISRPFHRNASRFYGEKGKLRYYRHKHNPFQELIEILITIISSLGLLKKLIHSHDIDVIHFIDNLGPAMRLIKWIFPYLYVTYSAPTYSPRGKLYNQYLKFSFEKLDKIIPHTEAYRKKLIDLGFSKEKLRVIRWSVNLPKKQMKLSQQIELRRKMGVKPSDKLFLWSGFIQQIQIEDFWIALTVAKRITKLYDFCHFIFAFKPQVFRQEYTAHESDYISIITNVQNFPDLLETADIFYSPVGNLSSIVSPPLTWIEAMARGTPVLTNNVKGVDEIVIERQTGFVAETIKDIEPTIIRVINDNNLAKISENARRWVAKKFNIETAAEMYVDLWREGVRRK
ncbi:MAG: hypothetical protein SRB2_04483 [Desulfobacteraceae bacterium Eth-SRB2]|nr:MAG: hypothetical protein SRB2_04483 [Desulfobacteraceae bacterium Eth-SRB2]